MQPVGMPFRADAHTSDDAVYERHMDMGGAAATLGVGCVVGLATQAGK